MQTIGTFHGTEVDYAKELVEARRLMGLKSTDMSQLTSTVGHLYLNCPEDMQPHYLALLDEIAKRQTLLIMAALGGTQ
jgi:hypothetical protein